jgi:hypothetical protein
MLIARHHKKVNTKESLILEGGNAKDGKSTQSE